MRLCLLDVRPQARFDASPQMLVGAQRCSLDKVPELASQWTASRPHQKLVTYCVYGHQVSLEAAAILRAAGLTACALAGGFEGGEEGVDDALEIARWREHRLPTTNKGDA